MTKPDEVHDHEYHENVYTRGLSYKTGVCWLSRLSVYVPLTLTGPNPARETRILKLDRNNRFPGSSLMQPQLTLNVADKD
jgi:hypothetical protein